MKYDFKIDNPAVKGNAFIGAKPKAYDKPSFEEFYAALPQIEYSARPELAQMYETAWRLAYGNIYKPSPENGFVSSYIDTAFNDCVFLWDSAFIVQFSKYIRSFDFMGTLDNFYAKQKRDGFIGREISREDGESRFEEFDPASTGPNVFAYAEWAYYTHFGDLPRLKAVFPVLLGYHRWLRLYRTWPDGAYWNSGWGCGLDNSPRFDRRSELIGFDESMGFDLYHGHNTWLDAMLHQLISADVLIKIRDLCRIDSDIRDIADEAAFLKRYIREKMYDPQTGFFYDLDRNGNRLATQTILAFWALNTDILTDEEREKLVWHLSDTGTFMSPVRVPSLARNNPYYSDDPVYWQGGVWAPTNLMVLQGLRRAGKHRLAREIAVNCVDAVAKVFLETQTLWEYYNPENPKQGIYSRRDFVGWSGLFAITILLEYVLGVEVDAEHRRVIWHVAGDDAFSVRNFPLFDRFSIDLSYDGKTASFSQSGTFDVEIDYYDSWRSP